MLEFTKLEAHRIPTNVSGNFIEIELYYSKGGMNVFTYKQEPRGYYIRVCPIKVDRGIVSFIAFSGTKFCILEVSRKSAKAEQSAIKAANECREIIDRYVKQIAHNNNLEV